MKKIFPTILCILGIVLVVGLIFYGYQLFFVKPNLFKPITIEALNGFYASLFTAIAVIAALIGLGAWRTIKELKEKLDKFKKIEKKVEFLYKKKKDADWIKNKMISVSEEGMNAPAYVFSTEEKEKYNELKRSVENGFIDDSWIELIIAQRLINPPEDEPKKEDFEMAESMYRYIEQKMGFVNDSPEVKYFLYHLIGQLYQRWVRFYREKFNFFKSVDSTLLKLKDEDRKKCVEYIEKAKLYYEKSHELNKDYDTLSNLSVVLIEFFKLTGETKHLDKAEKHLEEIKEKKPTYNTYWDLARVLFYRQQIDREDRSKEIRDYLLAVVRNIKKDKDIRFFKKRIEEESSEYNGEGFPRKVLFDEIMAKLKDC